MRSQYGSTDLHPLPGFLTLPAALEEPPEDMGVAVILGPPRVPDGHSGFSGYPRQGARYRASSAEKPGTQTREVGPKHSCVQERPERHSSEEELPCRPPSTWSQLVVTFLPWRTHLSPSPHPGSVFRRTWDLTGTLPSPGFVLRSLEDRAYDQALLALGLDLAWAWAEWSKRCQRPGQVLKQIRRPALGVMPPTLRST